MESKKHYFVLMLALISALLVFYQAGRVAPLIDYSYQIENAYRISIGDFPFRDFELVVAPGTYLISALLMRFGGNSFNLDWLVIYACFSQILMILLTYYVIRKIYSFDEITSGSLILIMMFTGYVIYPFPIYNGDVALFMLLALSYLVRVVSSEQKLIYSYFLIGVLIALPTFFKQNVGSIFLVSVLGVLFLTSLWDKKVLSLKQFCIVFLGALLPFVIFIAVLQSQETLNQAIFQLFEHPGKIRKPLAMAIAVVNSYFSYSAMSVYVLFIIPILTLLVIPMEKDSRDDLLVLSPIVLGTIVYVVSNYFLGIPPYGTQILSVWHVVTILSMVFVGTGIYQFRKYRNISLFKALFPLVPILTAHGAFVSQGVSGSSLHMEALLVIMSASVLAGVLSISHSVKWNNLIISISLVLSAFFAAYAYNNIRMSFIDLRGELNTSRTNLRLGNIIATNGPWLPQMEELLTFTEANIPKNEKVAFFPGEDPFFFLSGRISYQRCTQFNATGCSQTPENILSELLKNKIKWVIVKRSFQCPAGFDLPNWASLFENDKIPAHYTLQAQSEFYYFLKSNP